MKAGCLCALVLLSLPHCQAVGYGSHLLSLITGKHSNLPNTEALDLPLDEHLYETRVAKNADIDYEEEKEESSNALMEIQEKEQADQEQKESSSSYFDTLNLSYAGNMDFSKAVVQVSIETSL